MRRTLLRILEVAIFSGLIVATRCANYGDVFLGDNVYFSDADCYARMTRVRMCLEHPGTIVRHHDFENFPAGTVPHATAPFDYLVAGLSLLTGGHIDLAGAIISPFLALLTGWFLWWWSRRAKLPYRWALLLLFGLSPILVHATELGRPDHQSLIVMLIAIALCAEWMLALRTSPAWSFTSGAAWGLALWVSLYEPLILLAVLVAVQLAAARRTFIRRDRLRGWALCAGIVLFAFAIERRLPAWPETSPVFLNWAATIGELRRVPVNDPVWLRWTGLLLLAFPALLWIAWRRTRTLPLFVIAILIATFLLTMWQARWGYFFGLAFALALPGCLSVVTFRPAGWLVILISLFPILKDWEQRLWPEQIELGAIAERRMENIEWHRAAAQINGPFLAPWWWTPAVAYWSGQPGVAGSSHEAVPGIERSARLFLASDAESARATLKETKAAWILSYDSERLIANSAAILGVPPPENPLGRVLDRTPSRAPPFLQFAGQNSATKLYRVVFFHETEDFRR